MDIKAILDGMKIALQTELNGIQFYKTAAEHTEDKKGKETFQLLAGDEARHFVALKKQYDALAKSGKWAEPVELGDASILKGPSPIFSDEFKAGIKDRHYEMSALSIGALLETNSIDFYRKMKEQVSDPPARRLFEELQKWEENHLSAIVAQLNLVKEDYWAQANFVPLF